MLCAPEEGVGEDLEKGLDVVKHAAALRVVGTALVLTIRVCVKLVRQRKDIDDTMF